MKDLLCDKCLTAMLPGKAILNTPRSHNDFGNDAGSYGCTMTMDGPPVFIQCMKCPECGRSIRFLSYSAKAA